MGTSSAVVKRALLDTARRLFASRGFEAVTLRLLAREVGVNPALIHYYFGDKQGLYEAMLQDTLAPLFARLDALLPADAPAGDGIRAFLANYMRLLAANPWLPPLVMREVLEEGGRFRERFIRQFASRGGGLLVRLIEREQQAGRLRRDLDPTLAALSLVSLAVFPFLALPVTSRVFGMAVNEVFIERLVAHTERLFLVGVAGNAS
ncbi:MAG TPA: TetR family transcriptional regulator [Gammaproteobacteria bacterium]|nr:TetR family transcriptional regulator [Gammaproteobacteria bacterium]